MTRTILILIAAFSLFSCATSIQSTIPSEEFLAKPDSEVAIVEVRDIKPDNSNIFRPNTNLTTEFLRVKRNHKDIYADFNYRHKRFMKRVKLEPGEYTFYIYCRWRKYNQSTKSFPVNVTVEKGQKYALFCEHVPGDIRKVKTNFVKVYD